MRLKNRVGVSPGAPQFTGPYHDRPGVASSDCRRRRDARREKLNPVGPFQVSVRESQPYS
jgi:hypothetical protein